MKRVRGWVCGALLLLLAAAPATGQKVEERILPVMIGGTAGVIGGGYVALSAIVLEARMGNYLHDFDELFGWRSIPVLAGGALGAGLGVYSPERLKQAIIYGYGGMAAGGLLGLGVGLLIWPQPEGRWAGAAIGAGFGLVVGYLTGAITASAEDDLGRASVQEGIPVVIRIPL